MKSIGRYFLNSPAWVGAFTLLALVALPLVVFLDVRSISDQNLQSQASTLNRVISVFRSYYASNVVGRIVAADGQARPLHTYQDTKGGIPIPATLSIELGEEIGTRQGNVSYRFVSEYPFQDREKYTLTPFEITALKEFQTSGLPNESATNVSGNLLTREFTVATPVVMGHACVVCHNNHAESPKKDWRVGDIRGIQTVTVRQPLTLNLWSFKHLLIYLITVGSIGFIFAKMQFRQAREFGGLNAELKGENAFLVKMSDKLAKYLPSQIYNPIFAGEKDVEISTERKKLTVFFSDIKDFTATTERLPPDQLTSLLNEYFSEMLVIAERHGATIDKFFGDAIVAFFGDPVTRGAAQDARACLNMAIEMQARLKALNVEWLERGYKHPFEARIGINTGYCNVGNYGAESRMNYTIIGAEANLAARLENIAKPGGIVISDETWALVRDHVKAHPMQPVHFKGISRKVIPYEIITPIAPKSEGMS